MRDKFAITELCDALDVSRSGYHAALTRVPGRRAAASRKPVEHMKVIHAHRHTRSCGSPRMTRELKGEGMACSEKRVARRPRARSCTHLLCRRVCAFHEHFFTASSSPSWRALNSLLTFGESL